MFRCSGGAVVLGPEYLNTRTPEHLLSYPSIQLFVVRARAARDEAVASRQQEARQRQAAEAAKQAAESANDFLRDLAMSYGNAPGARAASPGPSRRPSPPISST